MLSIRTSDLTKQFDTHTAVHNVDLQVASGEVYGLIGPNGAGKTTLIRMLAAAEEPTFGEIYIEGTKLQFDRSNQELKTHLGYLPDDYPLYDDLSVWDYLDYFARLYGLREPHRTRRLQEVLELVSLIPKRKSQIKTLSRGMKQRLSLARTVMHTPKLLLLDEPVSGLDPIARLEFRQIIKALREGGMTVLISSHVLSDLAELCTSVGIMELGYLVESTSLENLYTRLSRQQIILASLGEVERLKAELRNCPEVDDIEVLPGTSQVRVQFKGTPEQSAALLRALVEAGIPLKEFHCTREDLETIFLKLDHKQAS
jgi:ABC-2 type transport system ATP-binding protein